MAEIKVISECYVKPKHEVEAAKQPYHLSPVEIALISIHPIQKGLLFSLNNTTSSDERTKLVSNLLDKLKHSLSIALVHFYPLAGRLATIKYPDEHACSIYVDCTKGPGARVIHATALDVTISGVIASSSDVPDIVQSMFELGEKSVNYDGHTRALLSIQVTELKDGVFIGFTINHSVADGTSFIHFVSMLSEIFRSQYNSSESIITTKISRVPVFDTKPWVDSSNDNKDLNTIIKLPYLEQEEFIVREYETGPLRERIFHFSPTAMAKLKFKANQECGTTTQNAIISSFQALSALAWKSITKARNISSDQSTSCSLLINTRNRFNPPLKNENFGNLIWGAKKDCNVCELLTNDLGWVAMRLHEEIKTYDEKAILDLYKYFAKVPMVMQPGVGPDFHGSNKVVIGGSARFDMYGPEFGLGRALAVRMGFANKEDGKVTANPGCDGGGSVELEICLKPHVMDALEANAEFMSFVSL